MTCAPTSGSSSARAGPSSPLTRPASPSAASTRPVSGCNTAAPLESRENCQVGVFLSYVTARGHALIDRELYLPMEWCEDHERGLAAGIPETRRFQTKPELAVQMLSRLQQAQVPISWVVADTDLRRPPGLAHLVRAAAVFLRAGSAL